MNYIEQSRPARQDEIDVVGAWIIIWRNKFFVAIITGVCILLALYIALTATPIFRAEVIVAPVHDTGGGGVSSLLNQFGGVASLAGIALGGHMGEDSEHEAVLESRNLIEEFMKQDHVYDTYTHGMKKPPTLWGAVQNFHKSVLNVHEDKLKELTTITVDWTDPAIASRWANGLVALANDLIRNKARAEASRNIDYLHKQLEQTSSIDIQKVMYELIEQETKTLMLANGRVEYAFTVVDPAVTPELRVSPKRTLIVLAGAVLGGLLGSFIAIFRYKIRVRAAGV